MKGCRCTLVTRVGTGQSRTGLSSIPQMEPSQESPRPWPLSMVMVGDFLPLWAEGRAQAEVRGAVSPQLECRGLVRGRRSRGELQTGHISRGRSEHQGSDSTGSACSVEGPGKEAGQGQVRSAPASRAWTQPYLPGSWAVP